MNKGDAILRLLMEIKLELKEVKEQVEQMQFSLKSIEIQNQKNKTTSTVTKKKKDWNYPSKIK